MPAVTLVDLKLLISGYLRENENELGLYMHIPNEIAKIMLEIYPLLLFTFGDFNKYIFTILNEERTILKGNGNHCHGHLIYADLGQYNNTGLNKGIHLWSVKLVSRYADCYLSIGVTTEKNDKLVNEWKLGRNAFYLFLHDRRDDKHWIDTGFNSNYKGYTRWKHDQVVTIKLNCNEWMVTYFKDGKEFRKDNIETNKSYYFAMLCCEDDHNTQLEIVENPNI